MKSVMKAIMRLCLNRALPNAAQIYLSNRHDVKEIRAKIAACISNGAGKAGICSIGGTETRIPLKGVHITGLALSETSRIASSTAAISESRSPIGT